MTGLQTTAHQGSLGDLTARVLTGRQAFGWCHTHDGLRTVRWDGSTLDTRHGPLDLSRTWSARIGGNGHELRWELTDDGGAGTEVHLVDGPGEDDVPVVTTIDQVRIVWGTVAAGDERWVELDETRTGTLHLPAPDGVQVGDRLGISTVELVTETNNVYGPGVTDAGNRAIVEELLGWVVRVQDEGGN